MLGRSLFLFLQIDSDLFDVEFGTGLALLGQVEPDSGRVRGNGKDVELHERTSSGAGFLVRLPRSPASCPGRASSLR